MNKRCPMCRQVLLDSYFDSPDLLEQITSDEVPVYEDNNQWFYEVAKVHAYFNATVYYNVSSLT